MVMVKEFEVAVLFDRHEAFDVRTTLMTSPLANELVVYVDEIAPLIFDPFFCH